MKPRPHPLHLTRNARLLVLPLLASGLAAFLAVSCGRNGPRPDNKSDGQSQESPASGTTATGGSKNSDNSDEDAGKGLSGTRPDDDVPVSREGRE